MGDRESPIIVKADGERQPFSTEKLRFSLIRSGAREEVIERVLEDIVASVQEGARTADIYSRAFRLLKKYEHSAAARYSLKRAVLDLGPSGYPFEDLLAEILRRKGYRAITRQMVRGTCTEHELDVIAEKGDVRTGIEVKFHNAVGLKSDIKVALYVKARFDDIATASVNQRGFDERWIVTNTKFSSQAEAFGRCAGMHLVSWSSPHAGNLQDLIVEARVHPLTCLTSLSAAHKRTLLNKSVVLCHTITENPSVLDELALSPRARARVLGETQALAQAESV